jgi:hypothetical protein
MRSQIKFLVNPKSRRIRLALGISPARGGKRTQDCHMPA